jgi:hypothetical protein
MYVESAAVIGGQTESGMLADWLDSWPGQYCVVILQDLSPCPAWVSVLRRIDEGNRLFLLRGYNRCVSE